MLSFTGIDHKGCSFTKPCGFSIRLAPIDKRRGCSQTIAFEFPTSSVLQGSSRGEDAFGFLHRMSNQLD